MLRVKKNNMLDSSSIFGDTIALGPKNLIRKTSSSL
jgi:hypothetical protein